MKSIGGISGIVGGGVIFPYIYIKTATDAQGTKYRLRPKRGRKAQKGESDACTVLSIPRPFRRKK